MSWRARAPVAVLLLAWLRYSAIARAATPSCERACLHGLADKFLASMLAHDLSGLPLAHSYVATENGRRAPGSHSPWVSRQ